MLLKAKNLFLDILFPSACLSCNNYLAKGNQDKICLKCLTSIPIYQHLTCPICGARVPDIKNKPACHPNSRYILAAASDYKNPAVREMIHRLKYNGWQSLANDLAELATGIINKPANKLTVYDTLILPMPLSESRFRKRGFNQAELLAEKLGRKINLPVSNKVLKKSVHTPTQAQISDWKARETNVKNSFEVKERNTIQGKNIILMDDVSTSGATLNEASRALKLHGAKRIIALVIAKAGK